MGRLPQEEPRVTRHFLDESLEDITFTNTKFDPKYLQGNEKNAVVLEWSKMPFIMPGVRCHLNGGVGSLRVLLSGRCSTTGLNRMKKKQITLYWSSRKKYHQVEQ